MPRIILGDARLELKKLVNEKFDMIILDAFSSDAIPVHLLTREAIEVYLQHLAPGGVILLHISNRFFHLDGPIAASGAALGLKNAFIAHHVAPGSYAVSSRWEVLAPSSANLEPLLKAGWSQTPVPENSRLWTDDYSNLLSTLDY
jgi:spermidine synthase